MFKKSSGFGIVGIVILIVVISTIGFAAWKLMLHNNTVMSVTTNVAKPGGSTKSTAKLAGNVNYLESSEMGIKIPLPDELKNAKLMYKYVESTSAVGSEFRNGEVVPVKRMYISTADLFAVTATMDKDCYGGEPGTLLLIDRYEGSHEAIHGPASSNPQAHVHYSEVTQFPNFHILIFPYSDRLADGCGAISSEQQAEANKIGKLLESAAKDARVL